MNPIDAKLVTLAKRCRILSQYKDMQGRVHVTSPDTQRALLNSIGVEADSDATVQKSLTKLNAQAKQRQFPEEVIVESGNAFQLAFGEGAAWTLRADDDMADVANGIAGGDISLPPLASGVYELTTRVGDQTEVVRILAAPRRLASVQSLTGVERLWGINLALYSLRSTRNSGLGDYEDLAGMATLAGNIGAGFVGVNPTHNMGFADSSISPYSPSHRGFLNTTHIALDAIPGLEGSRRAHQILAKEASQFALLRASEEVSYQPHKALHCRLMDALFAVFLDEAKDPAPTQLQAFIQDAGPELQRFAEFEALSEVYGSDWRDWPDVRQVEPDPERMQFHMWMQWVADHQLQDTQRRAKAAGLSLGLYLDLAVGPRRSGAESWCERASIAQDVSIGAPPDHLSPEGQNWDLSAFAPSKLQRANYRPFRRILAQTMRHAGVVRIDHVLGLNRSFLIPDNGCPGGYIRQPLESLIAIIKIEAERNNGAVIGEDLGLVPPNFRATMRNHGFYGYSVLQYEKTKTGRFRNPAKGRAQVLSCFATHDTPTVKGYETGCDIKWWQRLGWIDEHQAKSAQRDRTKDFAALTRIADRATDFHSSVHAILARSPASLISIQLDDILGVAEAQNLPGTIDEHPNWRRKYPVRLEDLSKFKGLRQLSDMMTHARPTRKKEALHDFSNS
ncbi:4-alpha-glucanotransferase [Aliiroseovarius sp. S1339]|uniref:4-alpha-glucanotransferase n=1 Tax=Aliiroseovarius sp. S1339 TaxID=2936990 RepID=UPI0020C17834|nr:4-alpha-glucanotransferase [Aliiroseovarius sp. S1339]MCK8463381.1 4-alpha-glucanotransferase [Aliiroseovarius sp. S1339]